MAAGDDNKKQVYSHLKRLAQKPLDKIAKDMRIKAHTRIAPNDPRAANHVLRSFGSICNYARRVHDFPACPTMAIEWFPERPAQEIIDHPDARREAVSAPETPSTRTDLQRDFLSLCDQSPAHGEDGR